MRRALAAGSTSFGAPRATWIAALAISTALLAAVLLAVDWPALGDSLRGVSVHALVLAVGVASLGGVFTTLRLARLTPGKPALASCLRVTAWHTLLLVALPARLGEVAAVYLIRHHLAQPTGTAIASLVVQRLLDALVLAAVFLVAALLGRMPLSSPALLGTALGGLLALGLVLLALERLLGALARIGLAWRRRRAARRLALQILRARTWYRHRMDPGTALVATLHTLAKWSCTLGGFVLLLAQLDLGPSAAGLLVIGVGYVFLAVLPLQTIGGLGVGEAGLAGMLVLSDVELGIAAGASVAVRCALLTAPIAFWCLSLGLLRLAAMAGGTHRGARAR